MLGDNGELLYDEDSDLSQLDVVPDDPTWIRPRG